MGIPIPGKTVYILRGVQTLESWVWAGSMEMTPNWQMARNISYTSNICIYIYIGCSMKYPHRVNLSYLLVVEVSHFNDRFV